MIHPSAEKVSNPKVALSYLKEGNKRFVDGALAEKKNSAEEWQALQEGQYPFAAILSCSDSRVSPEVIFDQKNGDLFIVRNAGNVADTVSQGSLEYAVKYLEVPLLVVCGHKSCGAVGAAYENLQGLPAHLEGSVATIRTSIAGQTDVEEATHVHTKNMADQLRNNPVVKEAGTMVVEAYYDIETGQVIWQDA